VIEKENARKQTLEQLHERRKQVVRLIYLWREVGRGFARPAEVDLVVMDDA